MLKHFSLLSLNLSISLSGGLVVGQEPLDRVVDGFLGGGELEVGQVLPQLGVGGRLLELAVGLVCEVLDLGNKIKKLYSQ